MVEFKLKDFKKIYKFIYLKYTNNLYRTLIIISSILSQKNRLMKQLGNMRDGKQILLTKDAFIRLAVLQSKIMRFMKRTQQVAKEINKIKTWQLQMTKIVPFVHRIHTFAIKIGYNELLSQCLHNFLALIGSFHPPSRVALVHLLAQCQKYSQDFSIFEYLKEAVTIIGNKLSDFEFAGVKCCIQFCKLTQNDSDFHIVLQRCSQFLEDVIVGLIFQNLQDQGKIKLRKSYEFSIYLSQNINTYLMNANQLEAFQYLITLYKIGSLKSYEQWQRNQYQIKLTNLQNFLAKEQSKGKEKKQHAYNKQLAKNADQIKNREIKFIRLIKNEKKLLINLDSPKKITYIPPIDFKNKFKIKEQQFSASQNINYLQDKISPQFQNASQCLKDNNKNAKNNQKISLNLMIKPTNLRINPRKFESKNNDRQQKTYFQIEQKLKEQNMKQQNGANKQNKQILQQNYKLVKADELQLISFDQDKNSRNNLLVNKSNNCNQNQKIESQVESVVEKKEGQTEEEKVEEQKQRQMRVPSINQQCIFKATWSCSVVGTNEKCQQNQKNELKNQINSQLSEETNKKIRKEEQDSGSITSMVNQIYAKQQKGEEQNSNDTKELLQVIQEQHEMPFNPTQYSINVKSIDSIKSQHFQDLQQQNGELSLKNTNGLAQANEKQKVRQGENNLLPFYEIEIEDKESRVYKIQYYLKHGENQQIIGRVDSVQRMVLPFSILQSFSTLCQSIKQPHNYSFIFDPHSSNNYKIVLTNVWHRTLQTSIQLSLSMRKTLIIHVVLFQMFCEDGTFDALITLSRRANSNSQMYQLPNGNQQIDRKSEKKWLPQSETNDFIGNIWVQRLNSEYWKKFQNLVEEVAGFCINANSQSQLTVTQNPNIQDILTLIQLIQ